MQSDGFLKVEISPPSSLSPLLSSPALSATTPTALTPTPGNSLSRRPSRKSTLTQQQKNQKRQRATQDQLTTLENEFLRNPTPTASVRERIAEEINMTERSVQIWFQNRRAKIKNSLKKNLETGEECDAIPESMRTYLAMQALETGKTFMRGNLLNNGAPAYGSGILLNTDSSASKVMIYHLACTSLGIGSWKRMGQTQLDLVVFYSPAKSMMTYYIQAGGAGYRIEYPFSYIKNITLDVGDASVNNDGTSHPTGGLVVELNRTPIFSMDEGSGGWFHCADFTEEHQASQVMVHHLGGHPKVLGGQLAKLISLDAFQNRHLIYDSAPGHLAVPVIDPVGFRPASQPNHIVHPRANLFPSHAFDLGAPPRGHKRQRSRSVPVAIDFSLFRPSKTAFMMHQHNHIPPQRPDTQPRIFTPMPQHPTPHPLQQQYNYSADIGRLGPTLNIDTGAGYSIDMPPCPPSTTSGASPTSTSDYESNLLATAPASDTFALSHTITQFAIPFTSPLSEPTLQHSLTTPLTARSHPDCLITHESPETPLLHRSTTTSARPSLHLMEDEKFDFSFLESKCPVPSLDMGISLEQSIGSQNSDTSFHIPQLSLTMDDQKWLSTDMSQKPFSYDPDTMTIQDGLLYDSYLTDPLGDPFLDQLSDPMLHHPLHDPIMESFHRRHKSKPSISTLPFRSFGEGPISSALSQAPPLPHQPEEFNFGHMVHCSEDLGPSGGVS